MRILEKIKLLPGINSEYELNMAAEEQLLFSDEELIRRSAFFSHINLIETNLYQLCRFSSLQIKSQNRMEYFKKFQYKTGYASHGLFPYKGKFHPQLVRSYINKFNLDHNSIIYDPMGGSGTTAIEANILGINAITSDVNPFCRFMIKVKAKSLRIDELLLSKFKKLSLDYQKCVDKPFSNIKELNSGINSNEIVKDLFTLAYLDAMGFQKKVNSKSFGNLLQSVSNRYYHTLSNFIRIKDKLNLSIGKTKVFVSDARVNILKHNIIDSIITSPPYSFAIDYIKNDYENIEFLQYDPNVLYNKVIGLRGNTIEDKLEIYFNDMKMTGMNMFNVLKPGGKICMIVGNNTNQTKGVNLSQKIIKIFEHIGLKVLQVIDRPIYGINNKMRKEYIQIYEK